MARGQAVQIDDGSTDVLSADELSQLDQMRDNDAAALPEVEGEPQVEESAADETLADDAGQRQSRTVPQQALHEAREQLRAREARIAELERNNQTLVERADQILQRLQGGQQAQEPQREPEIPDINTDPLGHILATQQRLQAQMQTINQGAQQNAQQVAEAQQVAVVIQRATAMEREFAAQTPDYNDAIQFMAAQRDKELAPLIPDPVQRQQMVQREGVGLAMLALQTNQNPAALAYEIAKGRGFAGRQQGAADRIANVAAGQRQAQGLGAARGGGPVPVSADTLARMTPKQFDEFLSKYPDRARELMGG